MNAGHLVKTRFVCSNQTITSRKAVPLILFCLLIGLGRNSLAQSLDGDALLARLKSIDSVYEAAFSASGTYTKIARFPTDVPPLTKKWRLTMSDGKIAYEEDVLEVLKWEDVLGPNESSPEAPQTDNDRASSGVMIALRSTYFFGPTAQAKYDFVGTVPPPGPLSPWPQDSPGPATCGSLDLDDPHAPTYNFELKRTLWSLGRGYSSHLTNITQLTRQENGLISLTAEGTGVSGRQGVKWELTVDPDAAYMVRSAKVYRQGQDEATISIANSGIEWHGSTCAPQKSEWKDVYAGGRTTSGEFLSCSSQPDVQFLKHAQKTMQRPYMLHTDLTDQRMTPELTLQYNAGELFPKGRRGHEQRILFEVIEHAQEEEHITQTQPISQAGNKTEDIIAAPTKGPDSAPSSPLGTATEARRTKALVAWVVLVMALVTGIAYMGLRIRGARSVNE